MHHNECEGSSLAGTTPWRRLRRRSALVAAFVALLLSPVPWGGVVSSAQAVEFDEVIIDGTNFIGGGLQPWDMTGAVRPRALAQRRNLEQVAVETDGLGAQRALQPRPSQHGDEEVPRDALHSTNDLDASPPCVAARP